MAAGLDDKTGALVASLGLDLSDFKAALKEANMSLVSATNSMQKNVNGIGDAFVSAGKKMRSFGKDLSLYVTAPLLGIGRAAFKAEKDFEFSMNKMVSLIGISRTQVDAWRADVLAMAIDVGKKPQELAEALYFITSAGLRGAEALDVLRQSAQASASGLGDTKIVADTVTSAMNAYKGSMLTAAQATDVLINAVRLGKVEANKLVTGLGIAFPVASKLKVSFDQVGAAIAAMTRTGTTAETAAVELRQILSQLLKPSLQAKKAFAAMQWSAQAFREEIANKGLFSGLTTFTKKIKNLGSIELAGKIFGNIRALTGVFDIMGDNVEHNAMIFEKMADSTGVAKRAFEEVSSTLQQKWNVALSGVQVLLVEVGETLKEAIIPLFADFSKWVLKITTWFRALSDEEKRSILMKAALAAAIGPVLIVFGTLISAIGNVIKGVRFLIIAFNALKVAIITNPIGALLTVLGTAAAALYLFRTKTDDATDAQYKLGEQVKDVNAAMGKIVFDAAIAEKIKAMQSVMYKTEGTTDDLGEKTSGLTALFGFLGMQLNHTKDLWVKFVKQVGKKPEWEEWTKKAVANFKKTSEAIAKGSIDVVSAFKETLPEMSFSELKAVQSYLVDLIPNLEAEVVRGATEEAITKAKKELREFSSILVIVENEIKNTAKAIDALKTPIEEVDNTLNQLKAIEIPSQFKEFETLQKIAIDGGDEFDMMGEKYKYLTDLLTGYAGRYSIDSPLMKYLLELRKQFNQTKDTVSLGSLQKEVYAKFSALDMEWELFPDFDVDAAKLDYLRGAITKLLNSGKDLSDESVAWLSSGISMFGAGAETSANSLDRLKETMMGLATEFQIATDQSVAFGDGFDLQQAKINAVGAAIDKLTAEQLPANAAAIKYLSEVWKNLKAEMTGVVNVTAAVQQQLGPLIADTISALFTPLEEGETVFGNILKVVADFISQIGQALIAAGAAALAFDTLLLNPIAAMAVGAAMVALGAVMKGGLHEDSGSSGTARVPAYANGGLFYGPSVGMIGEYPGAKSNPEVVAPLGTLKSLISDSVGGMGGGQVIFKIAGTELHGVLSNYGKQVKSYK